MIEIDEAKALELLAAEVEEAGADYVYKADERAPNVQVKCSYVDNGCPSCLVGRALFRAGVKLESLIALDRQLEVFGEPSSVGIEEANLPEDEVSISPDALEIFAIVQEGQDLGETWGTVLDRARRLAAGEEELHD